MRLSLSASFKPRIVLAFPFTTWNSNGHNTSDILQCSTHVPNVGIVSLEYVTSFTPFFVFKRGLLDKDRDLMVVSDITLHFAPESTFK